MKKKTAAVSAISLLLLLLVLFFLAFASRKEEQQDNWEPPVYSLGEEPRAIEQTICDGSSVQTDYLYQTETGQIQIFLKTTNTSYQGKTTTAVTLYTSEGELQDSQTQELSTEEYSTYTFSGLSEDEKYYLVYLNDSNHMETYIGKATGAEEQETSTASFDLGEGAQPIEKGVDSGETVEGFETYRTNTEQITLTVRASYGKPSVTVELHTTDTNLKDRREVTLSTEKDTTITFPDLSSNDIYYFTYYNGGDVDIAITGQVTD